MSYDMRFKKRNGHTTKLKEKHNIAGGTYALGGTDEAEFNITYNYSKWFYKHIDKDLGLRFLNNKTVKEVKVILEKAISEMSGDPSTNYWDATEGNAKRSLEKLLALANMCDDNDIFETD